MSWNDPNDIPFDPAGALIPGVLLNNEENQASKLFQHPVALLSCSAAYLMSAICAGHLEAVKSRVDVYGPPRSKYRSQPNNFLCESLLSEEEDIAKLLLECGADVNETMNGLTPLHHAVEKGYIEIVAMMLEKDALVNAKDDRNKTPLHYAVETKNLEIIELLLNKMADIEAKTKNGMTPLYLAVKLLGRSKTSEDNLDHMIASRCKLCISNLEMHSSQDAVMSLVHRSTRTMDTTEATETHKRREEVATLLMNRGADVDARNNAGKSVLQLAVDQCNVRIIERILLFRPTLNGKVNGDCLRLAVNSAGVEYRGIVKLLVDYGFMFKGGDAKHPVLLHNAVRNGHTKIVDTLLKLGADAEAKSRIANGGTLLHSAVATGRIRIAELLVERGADVNAKDKKDKTSVLYAVENMDPDMAKLLLSNGAKTESTHSLLHAAAERGCSHIMEMILERIPSVDVNAVANVTSTRLRFVDIPPGDSDEGKRDNDKKTYELTALHVAAAGGFAGVVELLLEHNANVAILAEKVGTPLHCSVLQRDETIVEMLLLKGADVDAKLEDGTTPLHLAVREGNAKAFQLLIKHGADVHKRNNDGLNLVHMATERGHLKIFEKDLLDVFEAGHPKTNDGLTALHMAVRMDSLANVEILLRHDADASVQDKNGVTPLHVAASCDHRGSVVKALLEDLHNVDTTDINGYTALHKAADEVNVAAAGLLLYYGCDVNINDKFGRTPLKIIRNYGVSDRETSRPEWRQFHRNWHNKPHLVGMIQKRIIKMMFLGLYVDPDNACDVGVSSYIYKPTIYKPAHDEFRTLVENMKRTKIGESKVSLYEFLTTGNRQLAFYSRNRSIAEGLKRGDLTHTFVWYRDMIELRCRKMKIINDLIDPSARALSALSGHSLSDYDYMEIVSYLDIRDLENVIKAGAIDEKSIKKRKRSLIRVSNPTEKFCEKRFKSSYFYTYFPNIRVYYLVQCIVYIVTRGFDLVCQSITLRSM